MLDEKGQLNAERLRYWCERLADYASMSRFLRDLATSEGIEDRIQVIEPMAQIFGWIRLEESNALGYMLHWRLQSHGRLTDEELDWRLNCLLRGEPSAEARENGGTL